MDASKEKWSERRTFGNGVYGNHEKLCDYCWDIFLTNLFLSDARVYSLKKSEIYL